MEREVLENAVRWSRATEMVQEVLENAVRWSRAMEMEREVLENAVRWSRAGESEAAHHPAVPSLVGDHLQARPRRVKCLLVVRTHQYSTG